MKIYTKTGDSGDTSLFAGGRVRKSNIRVDAYGTIDELNSTIGVARAHGLPERADAWLHTIQNELFVIGSDLATPMDANPAWLTRLDDAPIGTLENAIDQMDTELPELRQFILPGGTLGAASLHVSRTVCRRAERIAVELAGEEAINPNVIAYLNRLSDFLFTLARWVNQAAGRADTVWSSRG